MTTTGVALGADHAGVELKQLLMDRLHDVGYLTVDVGTHGDTPVDYPDYAQAVARAIIDVGQAERGVLICGSGIGASIAVNKIPGIRGGLCHDTYSARQGVQHDDMNVLVLGARVIGHELAWEIVQTFLAARFSGEERHRRRLLKIEALESKGIRPVGAKVAP
jgi:ribose 5-phosphate isomerase B